MLMRYDGSVCAALRLLIPCSPIQVEPAAAQLTKRRPVPSLARGKSVRRSERDNAATHLLTCILRASLASRIETCTVRCRQVLFVVDIHQCHVRHQDGGGTRDGQADAKSSGWQRLSANAYCFVELALAVPARHTLDIRHGCNHSGCERRLRARARPANPRLGLRNKAFPPLAQ